MVAATFAISNNATKLATTRSVSPRGGRSAGMGREEWASVTGPHATPGRFFACWVAVVLGAAGLLTARRDGGKIGA
ncbi:hypothetical protein [Propioniciclava flava]